MPPRSTGVFCLLPLSPVLGPDDKRLCALAIKAASSLRKANLAAAPPAPRSALRADQCHPKSCQDSASESVPEGGGHKSPQKGCISKSHSIWATNTLKQSLQTKKTGEHPDAFRSTKPHPNVTSKVVPEIPERKSVPSSFQISTWLVTSFKFMLNYLLPVRPVLSTLFKSAPPPLNIASPSPFPALLFSFPSALSPYKCTYLWSPLCTVCLVIAKRSWAGGCFVPWYNPWHPQLLPPQGKRPVNMCAMALRERSEIRLWWGFN